MTNELIVTIEENQVSEETAIALKNTFMPFFEQAEEWKQKAQNIIVTSDNQVDLMMQAREARLALKNIRVETEKKRKELKEESLRKGKAIDGMANIIKFLIVPIEEHLQKQEDFIKVKEEERKQARFQERVEKLSPYGVDLTIYNILEMSDESFNDLLATQEHLKKEREEAAKKAEQERIERERVAAEERERIRQENERLKREADERDRQAKIEAEKREKEDKERRNKEQQERAEQELALKKEREANEAKLKKEREEREKAEAELRAKKEAEEKARLEQERIEKEKQLAPDKKKLELLAVEISKIELPKMESEAAKKVLLNIIGMMSKLTEYIREQSINL